MAVMLVLGIAAAAVALHVHGPLRAAQTRDVLDALTRFDRACRLAARRQGRPIRIVLDLEHQALRRAHGDGRDAGAQPLRLPAGHRLEGLLIDGKFVGTGRPHVVCTAMGVTPSYALHVSGAGRDRWLVVAGLAGQVFEVDHEQQARQILAVAPRRVHPG